ncbi:fatty acyl-AMP ligase [Paraliomyxa miuraensis]|uniref:fatty acyl-AMP ligase n=1 Tax=Paraliomyxa miuraensis TaxID=376150 RepID=UPI002250B475|nr:fatty acyl-AMP ligase [Paraliomyxa miuraensis]MCX4243006.1 fatty acyl-AMP ligase [Paraliomyxa miuraensis]
MRYATLSQAIEDLRNAQEGNGFRFLSERSVHSKAIISTDTTFRALADRTADIAGALLELGLRKGDRVALVIIDNEEFISVFMAALRVGVIPVPIHPPHSLTQVTLYMDRVMHILVSCDARVVVASQRIHKLFGSLTVSNGVQRRVVPVSTLYEHRGGCPSVAIEPDDVAFLQFTSGSTSRPKGVTLTHRNLMANIEHFMANGLRVTDEDTGVSWLPLYHDMGLIGFMLGPMVYQRRIHYIPPLVFLKRPSLWLRLISHDRAAISFSPTFGFALCCKRAPLSELEGVDLSSWRASGSGGEPIRAEVMERFAKMYAPLGFRAGAHLPTYGLAESSLAVTFSPLGQGVQSTRFDVHELVEHGRAVPAEGSTEDEQGTIELTSCGRWFHDHDLGIFDIDDPRSEARLEDGRLGEIRIKGPSVMRGYWDDDEATARAMAGDMLKTGDIGFLHDGNLYVCGRLKEVIIINGRNYFPQDIEWAVSNNPGIRRGNVIAFGVDGLTPGADGEGQESVVILAERRPDAEQTDAVLQRQLHELVRRDVGVEARDVLILEPNTLPKTSSGKLQRVAAKDMYLRGGFHQGAKPSVVADRLELVKVLLSSQLGYLRARLSR